MVLVGMLVLAHAPRTDASVANAVAVERDAYGVPHISAPSQTSLAYAMGFSLAEDRPFQLDLFRRAGEGRLSELLGAGYDEDGNETDEYLNADIIMRRDFFDRDRLQAQIDDWDPYLRDLWTAYANGINAGWAEVLSNPNTHPVEFGGLLSEPAPWTTLDSLAVTLLFTIVDNGAWGGDGEFENAELLRRLESRFGAADGEQAWHEALWMNDPDTSTVIPDGDASPAPSVLHDPPEHPSDLQRDLPSPPPSTQLGSDGDAIKKVVADLGLPKLGSYAVAVAPKQSASGASMFLGAPQSGVSAPPVMWEVSMQAPGIDCAGGAVPGAGPFLILGRCKDHAWSVVSGNAGDAVDDVVEQRSGTGYAVDGATVPFESRTERFLIKQTNATAPDKTEFNEVDRTFLRTRHGTVFAQDGDHAWVREFAQSGHEIENLTSLFHLTSARSFDEADTAVKEGSWTVHITYADPNGIAYWFTGRNPVRADGIDPRLPTPGWLTSTDWSGFIPKGENPHVRNPHQGFLALNQGEDTKPVKWWPYSDDWRMGRVERRRATEGFVRDNLPMTDAGIKRVNKLACCDADPLVPYFTDALRAAVALHPSDERNAAVALLDSWAAAGYARRDANGDGRYDDPGMTIFGADDLAIDVYHGTLPYSPLWSDLYSRVFSDDIPAFQYYGQQDRLQILDRALRSARGLPTGLAVQRDYFANTGGWDVAIVDALDDTLASLRGRFGPDMSAWRLDVNTIPVTSYGILDVDDLHVTDHSSYNFVVDFADADTFQSVLAPGEGSPVSLPAYAQYTQDGTYPKHYVDQVPLYENFGFKAMRIGLDTGAETRALVFPGALTNTPPHAVADAATTNRAQPVAVSVLANDYDPDGDAVSVTSVGRPAHGSVSVGPSGVVTYTPDGRFQGTDSFTYVLADTSGATDTGEVSLTIKPGRGPL